MKKNYGFNGGKKLSVYVGVSRFGAPSSDCITGVKEVWNNFNEKWFLNAKRAVKKISIQKVKFKPRYQKIGTWKESNGVVVIYDNGYFKRNIYESVIIHESAHAWFHKQMRLNEEAVNEFKETILKLSPITDYTLRYHGKWSEGLYVNEIHSAVAEFLYDKNNVKLVSSVDNLELTVQAYKRLHERCE